MDNPKVLVGEGRFGRSLFAKEAIAAGEVIAEFDGDEYAAEKCTDLPKDIADHAIQFEENKWRDSAGVARFINHSCAPNVGLRGLFTLVAIADIPAGGELVWDYDMSEDSDWRLVCRCETAACRKIIGAFGILDASTKERLSKHASDWLVKKYNLTR